MKGELNLSDPESHSQKHSSSKGDSKIYGGTEVISPTEAPWMASVEVYVAGNILDSCGGTILTKNLILTAARCVVK